MAYHYLRSVLLPHPRKTGLKSNQILDVPIVQSIQRVEEVDKKNISSESRMYFLIPIRPPNSSLFTK